MSRKHFITLLNTIILSVFLLPAVKISAQDTTRIHLFFSQTLADVPQNTGKGYYFPSMRQSTDLANNFYELGYWGIDALGNKLVKPEKKVLNNGIKYVLSLPFVKYGSELPIPLGIWAHEEFHRSALQVKGINSFNGNWLLNRWDGTVYGVADEELSELKRNDLPILLRSYTAGVEAENVITGSNLTRDFYHPRNYYKNALYLYNAYYVYNYFSLSTSSLSDSVKVLAPPHENTDPRERDFAGLDLTAWIYDMTNPDLPYESRDSFPNGAGVNRRVGWSDLGSEGQDFLKKQEKLSLINFINPAIFFINRIKAGKSSFNFFMQYTPTPYGNSIDLNILSQIRKYNFYITLHQFNNSRGSFPGADLGLYEYALIHGKTTVYLSARVSGWMQPEGLSYYSEKGKHGGAIMVTPAITVGKSTRFFIDFGAKTEGWQIGNPYLNKNYNIGLGLDWMIRK